MLKEDRPEVDSLRRTLRLAAAHSARRTQIGATALISRSAAPPVSDFVPPTVTTRRICTPLPSAGQRSTSSWSPKAVDGAFCASRRVLSNAALRAWRGPVVGDRDRSHRSLLLQPKPWRGHCRLRAMVVASRRGGQPSKVRGSTLTHPQPIPHPYPHPRRRFCRFCRVPPDPSRAPCSGAHFCDTGSGITRLLLRVRERSRRLRISKARAARVGVRRAGIRGRGGERRGRDCDLVLCRAGAVRGRRERFGQYV